MPMPIPVSMPSRVFQSAASLPKPVIMPRAAETARPLASSAGKGSPNPAMSPSPAM